MVSFISSAESLPCRQAAENPPSLEELAGPPFAFSHYLTPVVFGEGG
jgi:hypothetical protein